MSKTRAMRLPEILTDDERDALLRQPNPRTPTGLRNLCMMRLMLNAGLRSSEVLNLKTGDINWITGTFKIKEGKGKKDRVLYLGENDLDLLKKWRSVKEGHKKYGPVLSEVKFLFPTLEGKLVDSRYMRAMVERYANRAGIEKDIHPHTLRHTFATDIYRQTKNIRLVQKALGHSNLATTMIYTHIIDEELEEAMKFFRSGPGQEEIKIPA